jgi:hypothetical protein
LSTPKSCQLGTVDAESTTVSLVHILFETAGGMAGCVDDSLRISQAHAYGFGALPNGPHGKKALTYKRGQSIGLSSACSALRANLPFTEAVVAELDRQTPMPQSAIR